MIQIIEAPRRKQTGYQNGLYFIPTQGAGNITREILRLRSGSIRLINFASQNKSLIDLNCEISYENNNIIICTLSFFAKNEFNSIFAAET